VVSALGGRVPKIASTAWVHPAATIVGDVEIGAGASIWPGAVLRGDFGSIRIGAGTSIQDNAVLHAAPNGPTTVGRDCVIAHLAFIEAATVGDGCMVAVGALVLPGAVLHDGSVAAAGAALAKGIEVPTGHRAQGVPAQIVAIGHPDRDYIATGARRYAQMAQHYAEAGVGDTGLDLEPRFRLPTKADKC